MSDTVLNAEHITTKNSHSFCLHGIRVIGIYLIRNRPPGRLNLTFLKSKVSKMLLLFGSTSKHLKIYPKETTMNVYKVLAISYTEELKESKCPKVKL